MLETERLILRRLSTDDAEFVLDYHPAKPPAGAELAPPVVQLRGSDGKGVELKLEGAIPGVSQRFSITVKGSELTVKRNDQQTQRMKLPPETPARGALGLRDTGSAAQFMNLYAQKSGRDLSAMHFYMVFAYFKLVVIIQQIYVRWVRGQTQDERFAVFGSRVRSIIHYAAQLVEQGRF